MALVTFVEGIACATGCSVKLQPSFADRSVFRSKPAFASITMAEDKSSRGRRHQESAGDSAGGDDTAPKKKRKRQRKAEELRHVLEQMPADERLKFAREAAITGLSARDVGFTDRKVEMALCMAAVPLFFWLTSKSPLIH